MDAAAAPTDATPAAATVGAGTVTAIAVDPMAPNTLYAGTECSVLLIALGPTSIAACGSGDADGNGEITIDEIITAVDHALDGCT